jgi:hypothetical protein
MKTIGHERLIAGEVFVADRENHDRRQDVHHRQQDRQCEAPRALTGD